MSDLNDPRVFFAAERTLLAWNRTSLALMAFGFAIERTGLLLHLLQPEHAQSLQNRASYWVGLALLLLGAWCACWYSLQYRKVLRTLRPIEIPEGYSVNSGPLINFGIALLGLALGVFLLLGHA